MRFVRLLAKLMVMSVVLAAPVASSLTPAGAGYPPGSCELAVSDSSVPPGTIVVVATVNCSSPYVVGASVTLEFLSDPVFLKDVTADGNGWFSTEVMIPADATTGMHQIRSIGPGRDVATLVLTTNINLEPVGRGGGGGGQLAFTGSDSLPWLWIALVLLTLGTILYVGARRRADVKARLDSH
jgi:hypothetical protein